jgi:type I restriction enzyme, S subunit
MEDVFDIARGGSPRPIDSFLTDDPDGVNWVMISDATESGKYINSTKKRIREEGVKRSRMVQPGDFLLTNSMSFGRPYIMNTSGCIHDGWLVLSPRHHDVSPDFFYHLLGSDFVYAEFVRRAAGATVKNLNIDLVKRVQVPLPPPREQRRIAEVLDRAEALRAKRRAALTQLDILTKSIFFDLFGDPIGNPRAWPLENLESFFQFRTGKLDSNAAVPGGPYPFFTCSRENSRIDSYAFDCEALLLAGNNASADYSVKHFQGKFNAYQRTYVITLRSERNSYKYAQFVLEHRLTELKRISKGTNTKYLTMELLNKIRVPVPPEQLQSEFTRRIAAVEQLKATYHGSLSELGVLFTSLQYRAFRGEL